MRLILITCADCALLGVCLLMLVAACGNEDSEARIADATAERAGRECAPRRLAHRFGAAALSTVPGRIVPVTFRDQDAVLAVGETPVAVQDGFYSLPYLEWPWVRERVEGAEPQVLAAGELNFEQIAVLRPDLILGTASGMTGDEHAILSQIAPTVAPLEEYVDFGVPWQETLRVVGRALCRHREAEERIAKIEGEIASVRERNPAFSEATAVVAMAGGPGGSFWAFGPQDSRGRFLASLGLEQPASIGELAGDRFVATLSAERLDLLDADVLIWIASPEQRAALEANPLYQRLNVVHEGGVVYLEPDELLTAAISNTTALNLPFLLHELVPRIAGAIDARSRGAGVE